MRTIIPFFFVAIAVGTAGPGVRTQALAEDPTGLTLSHCVVSLIAEAQIPARKPGVIMQYMIAEGNEVEAGAEIALIDDAEAQVQQAITERRLETTRKQSENDIDVRYAKSAALVAQAELLAAQDANARVPGTVPRSEIRKLELAENRAILGIEQAEVQFAVTGIESRVAEAQLDAAKLEVQTRRITSPISGVIVRLHGHAGEWVDAGQPICQVVGLEKLRVTGFVNVNEYDQATILGRSATASIRLNNGKTEKFVGTIEFASPLLQPGGEYRVSATVENRRVGKSWILQPGAKAQMTIDVPRMTGRAP